jgi:hypothetical protein
MQHGKGKICCSLRSRKHQSAKSGVSAVEYRESVALEERFRRDGWPQVGEGWDVPGLLRENTDPRNGRPAVSLHFSPLRVETP